MTRSKSNFQTFLIAYLVDLNANEILSIKNWFSYRIHAILWLYYFKTNSKAIVAIGDRPRMQIRDHPFFRSWAPIKSIFLIAIKATVNRRHRGRNCPYAGLKFKSLFYKREKFFFSFKARGRTKGKGRHSKEHFQKKVLTSRYNTREGESRQYRFSLPAEILDFMMILLKETYSNFDL